MIISGIFEVSHPCIQHALKKLLVAGKRGNKNEEKDIQEAIDSLERWKEMKLEDKEPSVANGFLLEATPFI